MTRTRLPILVSVIVVLVGAFVIERDQPPPRAVTTPADLARATPIATSDEVLGSTWYCAAGSAEPEGPADHVVVLSNPTDTSRMVTLTAFAGQEDPVRTTIELGASSVERVAVVDIASGPAVAVMAEIAGGGVVVHHDLAGPTGRDVGPCASTSSDVWHFAWGDTSRDARSLMALFNPFPGDAVVDFEFVTIEGSRQPQSLTGVVVPAESVIVADVGAAVTRRDQISTTVTARSGRVIAERIQVFDDTQDMLEGAPPRRALTVDLGAPVPRGTWVFPGSRLIEGLHEQIIVYNPGTGTAEVDVEVFVAGADRRPIEPFALTVRPNSFETLSLSEETRLTELLDDGPIEATVIVRSLNDAPVVAERVTSVPTSLEGPGIAASSGTPVLSREILVVDPNPEGSDASQLTIVNLDGSALVTGSIVVHQRGAARPLAGFEEFEIGPAGRLSIDLANLVTASGSSVLVVTTSAPVAVQVVGRVTGPLDRLSWSGIVRSGTQRSAADAS